ncbi:hypothetical protein MKX03_005993, partial [Papaver bracteatum]
TAYNLLQCEVLSSVFPTVLGNFSRAGVILHLWNVNHNVVLRGLLDVQNFDSESMMKIFGICQELKILSPVLDMAPFSFSIKLAALAFGKEQIHLEKWLSDNLSTYGDILFEVCLTFLKELRFDVPQDFPADEHSTAVANAYLETVPIFIKVLLGHAGQNVSHRHLLEEIQNSHIKWKADSYFLQMFSGQVCEFSLVQQLTRYKDSPEKREQSIYDSIISKFFEEYKYFPTYPERKLRVAAIVFGSLIKHQLVTHRTLDIALSGVLDALHESADSNMFVFGAKALEQFVDRLIEWPQYCNDILQISHLRESHLELVASIENALARISSHPSPSNGSSIVPTNQHKEPNPVPLENMEVCETSGKITGCSSSSKDDVHKPVGSSLGTTSVKPCSSGQQGSLVSTHDVVAGTEEAIVVNSLAIVPYQNAPSGPATVSSSLGFLRPSRGITYTRKLRQHPYHTSFGSALSTETHVAAVEGTNIPAEEIGAEYSVWRLKVWHISDDNLYTTMSKSNLICLILAVGSCVVSVPTSLHIVGQNSRENLISTATQYFKSPLTITCLELSWGFSLWIFETYHIQYEHADILRLGEHRTPYGAFNTFGIQMLLAVGASSSAYCLLYACGLESLATSMPVILYFSCPLYGIYYFFPSRHFVWMRVCSLCRIFEVRLCFFTIFNINWIFGFDFLTADLILSIRVYFCRPVSPRGQVALAVCWNVLQFFNFYVCNITIGITLGLMIGYSINFHY